MSQPEKERKDESNPPDPSLELFQEIDGYQKRIESEWNEAKKNYQEKIDQIMDDFVKENEAQVKSSKPNKSSSPPPPPPPKKPNPSPISRAEADVRFEAFMDKAKQTLEKADKKNKSYSLLEPRSNDIINATWRPIQPWRKKPLLKIFSSGLVIAALVAFGQQFLAIQTKTPLPYTHTYGVSFHEDKIKIVDWFRQTLYTHKKTKGLPIESVEPLPNKFVTGFTITNQEILTLNGFSKSLVQHALSFDHHILKKRPTLGSQPGGLYWDGSTVWMFDNSTRVLYRLHANDLDDVLEEFSLKGGSVADFEVVGSRVWTLNSDNREISVYRLQDPLKKLGSFDLDPFLAGGRPTGLHVEKKKVWVVTEAPSRLIQISRRKLLKSKPDSF